GGFRIPLIPAYADADPGAEHVPDLEPIVAGAEIELFLVPRAIGNMALAVSAHDPAIRADHREGVVIVMPVTFKKTGRDRDAEALCQLAHGQDRRMIRHGAGEREQRVILHL